MKNPFLVGEKIYLRTITEDDLNANYREWFNHEDVCRYNSHHRFPHYDESMSEYYESVIKSRKNLVLAICDKESDAHIGNVALENIDHLNQSAEFVILIGDTAHWGKGKGSDAAKILIRHGFNELNMHRIYCGTSEENMGMQKMALALGFKEEGRARDSIFKNGMFKDIIWYSLLYGEFPR